ncbi:hypothetical protein PpBr36_08913 [Pyricularia pennisetigena]|uniref:hypothetical protein n=1 Tax=Pyricularia pennisetigena TaxID=1578925 RepID=UPI001154EBDB|nr:hypothetical protein PpBr36_08913 [Pyricularia pennisetigena]TLS24670.1 hypothetical protein PpBr36_08913 [Pyricularia pennisetigena]
MAPVTRAIKSRQEALAEKKKKKPAAKRQASRKKAEKGPLVQETPAKKKTAGSQNKRPTEPPASKTAPVKLKSKQAVKGKPSTKNPAAAKKPGAETPTAGRQPAKRKAAAEPAPNQSARGKRRSGDIEQEGRESSTSTRATPKKRARRSATSSGALAESRWAKQNENDDEVDDDNDRDESGANNVPMAGLRRIKDTVVEGIRSTIRGITVDDKEGDEDEDVAEDQDEPAESLVGDFEDLIVELAPKKPNEKVEIPKAVEGFVSRSSDGSAFDFNFPVPEFKQGETLLWALKEHPTTVKVQLRLGQRNNQQSVDCFRVALSFQDEHDGFDNETSFCNPAKAWSPDNAGAELDNFLTLALSRYLHVALHDSTAREPSDTLAEVGVVVEKVLCEVYCATHCVVCQKPLGTHVWRPVACSPRCNETMATWPLELLMSPLLLDHLVLDFLLGCLNSMRDEQMADMSANLPAPVRNIRGASVRAAISSFPKLDGESTASSIQAAGRGAEDRRTAMLFLSFAFPGCLVSASRAAWVKYIAPESVDSRSIHQFVLLNSTVARQINFDAGQTRGGTPGQAAFHGTPSRNLLPILADGLRTVFGGRSGIFFGSSFQKSVGYQPRDFSAWPLSVFTGAQLIFGLENRGPPQPDDWFQNPFLEGRTFIESDLMMRNVFLFKEGSQDINRVNHVRPFFKLHFKTGTHTRQVMERTFRLIKETRVGEVKGPAKLLNW